MTTPESSNPDISPEIDPFTGPCLRHDIVDIEDARDNGAGPEEIQERMEQLSSCRGEWVRLDCASCAFNTDATKQHGDWIFSFSDDSRGIETCRNWPN